MQLMAMKPGLLNTMEYASHGADPHNTIPQPHHFLAPTSHMPVMPTNSNPSRIHVQVASLFMASVSRCNDHRNRRSTGIIGNMATETVVLDKIDKQILSILQTDGRISWQLLGDRVHLSANAVAERVRRMTRAGVIRGYKADVNQAALGRTLEAVIDARMSHTQGFDDAVMKRDDVLWAAHVTGESDVTLAVACDGTAGLDSLLRWLQREGATETRTDVVLRKIR